MLLVEKLRPILNGRRRRKKCLPSHYFPYCASIQWQELVLPSQSPLSLFLHPRLKSFWQSWGEPRGTSGTAADRTYSSGLCSLCTWALMSRWVGSVKGEIRVSLNSWKTQIICKITLTKTLLLNIKTGKIKIQKHKFWTLLKVLKSQLNCVKQWTYLVFLLWPTLSCKQRFSCMCVSTCATHWEWKWIGHRYLLRTMCHVHPSKAILQQYFTSWLKISNLLHLWVNSAPMIDETVVCGSVMSQCRLTQPVVLCVTATVWNVKPHPLLHNDSSIQNVMTVVSSCCQFKLTLLR